MQTLMADLYLTRDTERGLERTLLWLVSEVGELADLVVKHYPLLGNKGPVTPESPVGQELADCLAWLLSVANLLGVDLGQALLAKYPLTCSKCHQNPCQCLPK